MWCARQISIITLEDLKVRVGSLSAVRGQNPNGWYFARSDYYRKSSNGLTAVICGLCSMFIRNRGQGASAMQALACKSKGLLSFINSGCSKLYCFVQNFIVAKHKPAAAART
jgi:hypothetical protein